MPMITTTISSSISVKPLRPNISPPRKLVCGATIGDGSAVVLATPVPRP
jgi:hypothetical protein